MESGTHHIQTVSSTTTNGAHDTCNVRILTEVIYFLGFRTRCLAIDLFMPCSTKGVSRCHLTSR